MVGPDEFKMQLHYEKTGSGFPVIILHGLFGSSDNWRTIAKNLSSLFLVVSVDQRNHGRSPHDPQMSYELMAGDVADLMHAQGWQSAYIIGHSMGGKTAMELALRQPDKVDKLVVVDIGPREHPLRHDHILDALLGIDLNSFGTRHAIGESLATAIPDRDVVRFLLKSVGRDATGRFRWLIGLKEIAANYSAIAAGIAKGRSFQKPCLLVRGELSDYLRPEDEDAFRELFPMAEVRQISGAGHWVHAESPAEFTRVVMGFLQRVG